MSDPIVAESAPLTEVPAYHEPDFDKQEVKEFNKDDGEAVMVIGKMLVSFFLYSLIVMLLVGVWTYRAYKLGSTPSDEDKQVETSH